MLLSPATKLFGFNMFLNPTKWLWHRKYIELCNFLKHGFTNIFVFCLISFAANHSFNPILMIFFLNPLQPLCCFSIPPENIRKPLGFLMFSGGIEKQHRGCNGLIRDKLQRLKWALQFFCEGLFCFCYSLSSS